jgi:hypothetical protein
MSLPIIIIVLWHICQNTLENRKFFTFSWDGHAMAGFDDNVPNFLFLAMRFILANVTQNYNATR